VLINFYGTLPNHAFGKDGLPIAYMMADFSGKQISFIDIDAFCEQFLNMKCIIRRYYIDAQRKGLEIAYAYCVIHHASSEKYNDDMRQYGRCIDEKTKMEYLREFATKHGLHEAVEARLKGCDFHVEERIKAVSSSLGTKERKEQFRRMARSLFFESETIDEVDYRAKTLIEAFPTTKSW
jgi:hypothetical protein